MTQLFFASRTAARSVKLGKFVDNGPEAPKGQRYARAVSLNGNAKQRRKSLRSMLRSVQ